jgi:multiple sugar transport system permease protein
MAVLRGEQLERGPEVRRRGASLGGRLQGIALKAALYAVLTAGAVIFAAPFAWMVVASLQSQGNMFRWPPSWIPIDPSLNNYARFLGAANIGRWFFNSAYVALSVTFLQLFFNSLAAYTYAKRKFPGRDFLFLLGLGTMMIPGMVTLIPSYIILGHMPLFGGNDLLGRGGHGWLDSYWGLIAPGIVSTFGIFLLRQYMKSIPDELLDAARIDGASHFRMYWQIALPLSVPALAAHAIFTFQGVWEDFFWPLIIISSEELYTVPLGLTLFVVKNRTVWDQLMAGSVLVTLPVLIVFLVFQRQFIQGIALTGMK